MTFRIFSSFGSCAGRDCGVGKSKLLLLPSCFFMPLSTRFSLWWRGRVVIYVTRGPSITHSVTSVLKTHREGRKCVRKGKCRIA